MRTQTTPLVGRVVVYALRCFDRYHFKADWATGPVQHIAEPLPILTPVLAPTHVPVVQEAGPQETWWALEDLWTRLSMCTALTIERDSDICHLVLPAFRHAREGVLAELRNVVFDTETYTWRREGARGEFVSSIDYQGDDLVCTLTRSRRIEAWPGGEDLLWQVRAFLLRLERSTAAGSCA